MWQKADKDRVLFLLWSVLSWILALVRFCNVSPRRYRNLDAGGGRNPRIIYSSSWHLSAHASHPSPIAPSTAASTEDLSVLRHREWSQFADMLPIHPSIFHFKNLYSLYLYPLHCPIYSFFCISDFPFLGNITSMSESYSEKHNVL